MENGKTSLLTDPEGIFQPRWPLGGIPGGNYKCEYRGKYLKKNTLTSPLEKKLEKITEILNFRFRIFLESCLKT